MIKLLCPAGAQLIQSPWPAGAPLHRDVGGGEGRAAGRRREQAKRGTFDSRARSRGVSLHLEKNKGSYLKAEARICP